jgi:hypothetical protein
MASRHPPMRRAGIIVWMFFLPFILHTAEVVPDSNTFFQCWLHLAETEFDTLNQQFIHNCKPLSLRLREIDRLLATPNAQSPEYGYPLLLEKIRLEDKLRYFKAETDLKLLRLRFRKSIEMLKMLYEKILGMDHHFTSLRTSQQVARISNPHEYPVFKEVKTLLQERMKKKYAFALPAIMEGNPYLSAVFSIVSLTLSGNETKLNKQQLDQISCILDFTVRMHQELSVIYYETEYLRDGNLTLKVACENLFAECARQVGYDIPLTVCRETDDWERLYALLDNYVNIAAGTASADVSFQQKARTNLQFSVDRVVHFIEKYCAFVAQGNEYYKKFDKIVGNYANENTCAESLPETFRQLKTDIGTTLEKFNSAYNLPEIQGSRLKDLLYGIGE